jgi:hypothetical protein
MPNIMRVLKPALYFLGADPRGHSLYACARELIVYIERYFELLKDAKVKGYLFAQQNYMDGKFNKQ